MNKDFMYGLGAVEYKGKPVGYIGKDTFEMGGSKPEATKIDAEQVPGAPVLVIAQSNGKIAPKFDMIQLNFDSLNQFLGGMLHKNGEKIVGWTAPSQAVVLEGPVRLDLVSGQSILIPNATMLANLGGKLTLKETAKIEVELEVCAPTERGVPPYGVFETTEIPAEWDESKGWTLPKEAENPEQTASAQSTNEQAEG